MKIRLKNIIMLSYIFIILIFFLGITLIVNNYILDHLTQQHIEFAEKELEELTDKHEEYTKKALLDVSRDFINLYANESSKNLSPIIEKIKYNTHSELVHNEKLRDLISQPIKFKNREVGHSSLIASNSLVIIDTDPKLEGTTINSWKEQHPEMWEIFQKALKDKKGNGYYYFKSSHDETIEKKYMSIVNIPKTDLFICSYMDLDVICDPVNNEFQMLEKKHTKEIRDDIEEHSLGLSRFVQRISLGLIIFLSLVCVVFAMWIANKISSPIMQLNIAAKKLGEGHFNTTIEEKGSLEIIELSNTFNELGEQLALYMENLKKEISIRESFESELKIARNIQMAILQQKTLHDPRTDVSLYATLFPAKNVAGDFYDFFYLDEVKRENLVVLIADVSGKGIYAAIFMAMAKTIIKNLCQLHPDSPAEALQRANNLYLNSESMFVTMFLGYYNIANGELTYANGGHHSAIRIGKDNSYEEFGVFCDPLLGLFPDNTYQVGKEKLAIGDKLFLYTDGLTEAVNKENEAFGEETMKKELLNNNKSPLNETCNNIFDVVNEFEGENRFDDITMLILKRDK